jgi:hypothetical protein
MSVEFPPELDRTCETLTGWTEWDSDTVLSLETTNPMFGDKCIRCESLNSSQFQGNYTEEQVVCAPNTQYTVSVYLRSTVETDYTLQLQERQADGSFVLNNGISLDDVPGDNTWRRYTGTFTTSADTERLGNWRVYNNHAVNAVWYIDGFQLDLGSSAQEYDGVDNISVPNAGQYKRLAWKVRWDEGYEGRVGFAVPELENMRYAAPQMEQGELPTAFALNPDDLLPGRVEGGGGLGHIAAETIIGSDIQAGSVHADRLVSNSITATQIEAGSITSNELNVGTLSAITADMGEITAGLITLDGGATGLGGLIQTSPDNPKVTFDENGLLQYDAAGVQVLKLGPSESLGVRAAEGEVVNGLEANINDYTNGSLAGQDSWATPSGNSLTVSGTSPNKLAGSTISSSTGNDIRSAQKQLSGLDLSQYWVVEGKVSLLRGSTSFPTLDGSQAQLSVTDSTGDNGWGVRIVFVVAGFNPPFTQFLVYNRRDGGNWNIVAKHVTSSAPAVNSAVDYDFRIDVDRPGHIKVLIDSITLEAEVTPLTVNDPLVTLRTESYHNSASGTSGAYFKAGLNTYHMADPATERKIVWNDATNNEIAHLGGYKFEEDSPDFPLRNRALLTAGEDRETRLVLDGGEISSASIQVGSHAVRLLDDSGESSFVKKMYAKRTRSTAQTITPGTWTTLMWTDNSAGYFDPYGLSLEDDYRITLPVSGIWLVSAQAEFLSAGSGGNAYRGLRIILDEDSSIIAQTETPLTVYNTRLNCSGVISAGDTSVYAQVFQGTANNLDTSGTCWLSAVRVG